MYFINRQITAVCCGIVERHIRPVARLFKKATCIRIAMVLQLVLIAGAAIVFAGSNDAPRAMNGFLDLSKREWKTDGPISLKGEWYMYWGKLLKPQTHSELERSKDVRRS